MTRVIVVLDPHDIVLAEIAAGLHLDRLEIDLAGIFQTMRGAARRVNQFVLATASALVADRHRAVPRTPPSARPMMMHGGDSRPPASPQTLDLIALAELERLVRAPSAS
jgi:hypothetical protein